MHAFLIITPRAGAHAHLRPCFPVVVAVAVETEPLPPTATAPPTPATFLAAATVAAATAAGPPVLRPAPRMPPAAFPVAPPSGRRGCFDPSETAPESYFPAPPAEAAVGATAFGPRYSHADSTRIFSLKAVVSGRTPHDGDGDGEAFASPEPAAGALATPRPDFFRIGAQRSWCAGTCRGGGYRIITEGGSFWCGRIAYENFLDMFKLDYGGSTL